MANDQISVLRRLTRSAASTWTGLALIALILAYLSVASVWPEAVAAALGTSPQAVYRHPLPVALGGLLCASLLLATLTRIPLRLPHAGAWCSHLGVLLLAGGAAWYAIFGASGYCVGHLRDDPDSLADANAPTWAPCEFLYLDDTHAAYVAVNEGEPVQTPLPGLDLRRDAEYSLPLVGAPDDVALRVLSCEAGPQPALNVELRGQPWSSVARLPLVEFLDQEPMVAVNLPDTRTVRLAFSRQRRPLPEPLQILRAEFLTHPGSVVPKDYRCDVGIGSGQAERAETVSLNHPLRVGPYQLSQGAWWPDPRAPEVIVFGVRSRPGLPLIWAGLAMIVAGMVFAYHLKPLILRRRGKVRP